MFILSIRLISTCGRCPMLSQFPRNLQNTMSALIDQFPYCLSSASVWRVTLKSFCWNTSSNNLLSNDQFGFCANQSTVVPLLLAIHQWHKILDNGKSAACEFFDLRKAFNSVPHQALLNRLFSLQIPIPLIRWISNYLSNCYQKVFLNGVSSPYFL